MTLRREGCNRSAVPVGAGLNFPARTFLLGDAVWLGGALPRMLETMMKCPVCVETDLVMTARQNVEIDYCPKCRGVWLERGEPAKILETSDAEGAPHAPPPPAATPPPAPPNPR